MLIRTTLLMLCLLPAAIPAAAQQAHVMVIVGVAGEPAFGETFQRWATTLVDGVGRFGVDPANVIYLHEKPDADPKRITGRSTRPEVEKAFARLAEVSRPDDVVLVLLIGHGTFDGRVARFNLPGPDMTPADFEPLLKRIQAKQIVFVNTSSASAPFLHELAAPGRTIVTATRTGHEHFATLFGGYFVDALVSDEADLDKNRRVSILEAFTAARLEVARAYEREGLMRREHALLDDTGDRKGVTEPSADGPVGRVAAMVSIGTTAEDALPEDPALRALHVERRDLEQRIESLKMLKGGMDQTRYASELETLLTALALKTREIREAEAKRP
jgi:hypothetical protein